MVFRRRRPARKTSKPRRRMMRRTRRPGLRNIYKFKRQAGTSFVTWKYDATNGIVVNTQGLIAKGAVTSSTLSTVGGLTGYYDVGLAQWFQLSDVPSATDFTNLYDRYKITGVKLQITYLDNSAAVNGLSVFPVLNYAIDYDDNSVPSSESQMQEKQDTKTKVLIANKPINIFVKYPRYQAAALNNAGTFDAAALSKGYINCTYPTVKHSGVKFWISSIYSNAGSQCAIRIVPTYYLSLKDPQ